MDIRRRFSGAGSDLRPTTCAVPAIRPHSAARCLLRIPDPPSSRGFEERLQRTIPGPRFWWTAQIGAVRARPAVVSHHGLVDPRPAPARAPTRSFDDRYGVRGAQELLILRGARTERPFFMVRVHECLSSKRSLSHPTPYWNAYRGTMRSICHGSGTQDGKEKIHTPAPAPRDWVDIAKQRKNQHRAARRGRALLGAISYVDGSGWRTRQHARTGTVRSQHRCSCSSPTHGECWASAG